MLGLLKLLWRLIKLALQGIGVALIISLLWLWPRSPFVAPKAPDFEAVRAYQYPIISTSMSRRLSELTELEGFSNVNGPSVIRVPDWVENPLGKYYLYFAHHKGDFIRLAYADEVRGPWTIYEPGSLSLRDSGFPADSVPVQDTRSALIDFWNAVPIRIFRDSMMLVYRARVSDQAERTRRGLLLAQSKQPHIASPDVVVDHENQRIVMFYHGLNDSLTQLSRVATSIDGVHFQSRLGTLPANYLRSFKYGGKQYLLGALGILMRSDQLLSGYEIRTKPLFDTSMRHLTVQVDESNDRLHILWSRVGDAPERILYSAVQLQPDWNQWQVSEGVTVLQPELDWEGAALPVLRSLRGESAENSNELRDPYLFVDHDGNRYLFYSGAAEQAIGLAFLRKKPK